MEWKQLNLNDLIQWQQFQPEVQKKLLDTIDMQLLTLHTKSCPTVQLKLEQDWLSSFQMKLLEQSSHEADWLLRKVYVPQIVSESAIAIIEENI